MPTPVTVTIKDSRLEVAVAAYLYRVGKQHMLTDGSTGAQKLAAARASMIDHLNAPVAEYERAMAAANDDTFS